MNALSRGFTVENKKKVISHGEHPLLSVNLKYPAFTPLSAEPAEKRFTDKVNRFYEDGARKYLAHAASDCTRRAAKLSKRNGAACSLVMNCEVPYAGEKYISVFADISAFDGKDVRTLRLSQLWSAEKGALLPPSYIFRTGSRETRYVKSILCEIAESNARRKIFTYFDNYKAIINRKFRFSASYLVPNGAAFYFDGGVLSASMRDICVFVVPFERIDGLLKIAPG